MPPEAELSCQELVELVTAYFDGALGDEDRARFDEHLAICHDCRVYLDQLGHTMRAVGTLSEETADPVAVERLRRAFRAFRQTAPHAADADG
jgi:predicted anti-sigma-YlaC factor YlaD